MINKTCSDFINELGSSAPVPGGGSAAALVGALGIALGTMANELTSGKKKYAAKQAEIEKLIERSKELTEKMKAAVEADVTAFEPLAAAYRLPNGTEEEKKARSEAVQAGLPEAAKAPLELMKLSVESLKVLRECAAIENMLVISDVGTGAAFCEAALRGARLNVLTNLRLMNDASVREDFNGKMTAIYSEGMKTAAETYDLVADKLSRS